MADTSSGRICYVKQTVCTELPAPLVWRAMRMTSSSLAYEKKTSESNELNYEGMVIDLPEVGARSAGQVSIEWSAQSYDDFIEAVLRGTWENVIDFNGEITASASDAEFTAGSGTPFANARVGQMVLIGGFSVGESYPGAGDSPNNRWWEIQQVVSPQKIKVNTNSGSVLNGTASAGFARSKYIVNGRKKPCFALEESFTDANSHLLFLGQRVGSLSFSLTANQITTGQIEFVGLNVLEYQGQETAPWSANAQYVPANSEAVLNATANVGNIIIDNAVSTGSFRSLNLTINNNLRETGTIGAKFPRVGYGRQSVSGTFEKLFVDLDLWRAMKEHAAMSLAFGMLNPERSHGLYITLPRLKIASDQVDLSGGNDSDVIDNVSFSALRYVPEAGAGETRNHHIRVCVA